MNNHKLAYFGGRRVVSACRRSCCWHFDQERFCTYFERFVHMEPMSVEMKVLLLGKELRLPWLSSLASQNGATGGITAQSSSARSCSCRAHVGNPVLAPALTTALDLTHDLLLLWPCS